VVPAGGAIRWQGLHSDICTLNCAAPLLVAGWCLQAVLSGGKVYTVDRIDVAEQAKPPLAPAVMPSLMWTEISVQVGNNTYVKCNKINKT
jgi:hypothetical protein